MDLYTAAFIVVGLASLLAAPRASGETVSLGIVSTAAAGAGAALARHLLRSPVAAYTASTGTYVGTLVPADSSVQVSPSHPIMRVKIGDATLPALLDTGFGTTMTVTLDALRAVGSPPGGTAAAAADLVARVESPTGDGGTAKDPLRAAREVLKLSLGASHTVHMVGLASSASTESTRATGVLQFELASGEFSSPDSCARIPMLITDLPLMPCIVTMPYLMSRAPLTLSFSTPKSSVSLAFGEALGAATDEGVCVPRQQHAGGVCIIDVDIVVGGASVRTCLIVDTGFPGTITLNESVAKRLQAPCTHVVSGAGISQVDVFYQDTCSGVLQHTDATIAAATGNPIRFDDFSTLVTTGDMEFGDGLIGMGLLQSLEFGLVRGPNPLRLKDTKLRNAVVDANKWANTSQQCSNPVSHCRADGVGSE